MSHDDKWILLPVSERAARFYIKLLEEFQAASDVVDTGVADDLSFLRSEANRRGWEVPPPPHDRREP